MRIVGFAQDNGACTAIRIRNPVARIGSLGLADTYLIGPTEEDIPGQLEKADIVILGRAFAENVIRGIDTLQSSDKPVVFDLDDNFFNISPFSPHYKELGIMPVNMESMDGLAKVPMWEEGVNFEAKKNRKVREMAIEVIRSVSCLTVTTAPLKKVYSRFNDNVRIVPNALDFRVWNYQPIKHMSGNVRILWTGAGNHTEDFMFIQPVLSDIQKKYPNVTIVFAGSDWRHVKGSLDYSRVEVAPWTEYVAYPYVMKSLCCDIGIAPIRTNDFDDCRSNIKWLEYSALKMATVATNFGDYKRTMKSGKDCLLVEEKKDWFDALSRLIEDETYRKELAENAYKEVRNRYNLDFVADRWAKIFKETLGGTN
jgi:glycosyltransferase involved in cell wall biosynthesis